VANAGADQTVVEQTVINLAGTASDPDGDTLTIAWTQTAGPNVTINTPDSASASFTAPDVAAGSPEVLTFQLSVSDPDGLNSTDQVSVTVQEPPSNVLISGNLLYEFPPPNPMCQGLNFAGTELRPIRQATVQLLDAAATTVLDSTVSDDAGAYTMTAPGGTDVIVRIRAELKRAGAAPWDVEVRNNVDTSPTAPPLDQRPIYVMDSAVFNSGGLDQTRDMTATTGWGVTSYTGPRVAAPFAILDSIYTGMQLILSEDPTASFEPLDAYWSVDNSTTQGSANERANTGEIGTSFYTNNQLFLLGRDGDDTEEFDDHVVVHEWGHYFEDNFSRSDSIGGQHGIGDSLDKRVAFGEGFATALSGMALDNPSYCDTLWFNGVLTGFEIDIESGNTGPDEGWYNEVSVLKFLYDLWDDDDDGVDNSSIGFGPILAVMTGEQATTPAFTSIFSFATYLKQQGTGQDAFIDALLAEHDVTAAGIDIFGSTETNDGPGTPDDVLPIYTDLTLGVTETICANSQFDTQRAGNKLSEHRYLRLNLAAPAQVTFSMITQSPPSTPTAGFDCTTAPATDPEVNQHSDPDFLVWRNGQLFFSGFSCEPNAETPPPSGLLAAGEYVIDINEFRHADDDSPAAFPERICFDFTATL